MSSRREKRPPPFLDAVVSDAALSLPLLAVCAGFERGRWRAQELARHLFEWLPDFALNHTEYEAFGPHNAAELFGRAAWAVYESDRYEHRGEFGELLLHAIIREQFDTEPAISKLYFKDSANDTVKGFDAVHVVAGDDGSMELWLGEVKFYGNVSDAMTAVAAELRKHTDDVWVRREFMAISNKIDPTWPHAGQLRRLIHRNTSLDELVRVIRVPVLVTYDSPDLFAEGTSGTSPYRERFEAEVREHQRRFARRDLPADVVIHLLLMPLPNKQLLVDRLDEQLRVYQRY